MKLQILVPFLLFTIFQKPTFAAKSYIVYLGGQQDGYGDSENLIPSSTHEDLLNSVLGSKAKAQGSILYSYSKSLNGFAAVLEDDAANEIRRRPGVLVFPNNPRKLHTTHSWEFLGLEKMGVIHPRSIWEKAKFGEDVIIGNLDTGVWPESKSFSDEGMGPVPARWKGACHLDGVGCNRKLIGARSFYKGYNAVAGYALQNSTMDNPRDYDGHGSHTLSTAGGNFVPGASVFGNGNGTAKGGSPKARVASYKVCWPTRPDISGGCFDADILAAIDAAINDGVDVLSLSLGSSAIDYVKDATAFGTLRAVRKGITVVCSAGNDGPNPQTATNIAPWILTVGASTIDRKFSTDITLGDKKILKGVSLSDALPKSSPLLSAADANALNASTTESLLCKADTLDPAKVKGKILVCLRGDIDRTEKSQNAALAGALGMILANDKESGNEVIADTHIIPSAHINFADGQYLFSYIKSTKSPVASLTPMTEVGLKPAPVMAAFSSRGPNLVDQGIIKPDITAPGVDIIAAYSEAVSPSGSDIDKRRSPYNTESGTSMSCPHVAGVVGLIKALHPDWSPAAIKSAIMTTARSKGVLDSNNLEATPFAYGSGHLRPNRVADPGLVYDITEDEYLNYLCSIGYISSVVSSFAEKQFTCPQVLNDLNYPSIAVYNLVGSYNMSRRVKNVGPPGTYTAHVRAPENVSVVVEPTVLTFSKTGEEKNFTVILTAKGVHDEKKFTFGELIWSDGKHTVRSPIAVNQ